MRSGILLLFSAALASGAEIPKGAHVLLRLVNSIDTRTAREGDYVYLRTATPVIANGQILVPVDSYAQGVVTSVKRSGRVTGRAELGVRIETLSLASGKTIKLTVTPKSVDAEGTDQKVEQKEGTIQQGSSKLSDAARIAQTAGTGAAIGAIADRSWTAAGIGGGAGGAVGVAAVLLSRGKEVTLRAGSTIDVVFDRAVPVE